jgi:hypothetical protein
MNQRRGHTEALFLLLLYIVTGPLAEVLHHHPMPTRPTSRPQLMNHECGNREIHPALDGARPCAVCSLVLQRVSLPATSAPPVALSILSLQSLPDGPGRQVCVDYLFTGKRGPPAA